MRNWIGLLALLTSACGVSAALPVPGRFVELEQSRYSDYDQRLTTANGVVIGLREIDNDPYGDAAFWTQAVRNHLQEAGGYALTEEREVTAASGERGLQLRFGRDEERSPHVYWLTIFVTEDHIVIVEAGGEREEFEATAEEVERVIIGIEL